MQKTLGDMLKGDKMSGPTPQFQPRTLKDWQKIVGTIGDALQVAGGGRGTFLPAVMEDRQRMEAMQQRWDLAESEGRRRMAEKQWERANPTPTAEMRNFAEWQTWDEPTRALYDQFKPVITSTWQGPQAVPRSSLGPPTKPVGKLTPIEPQNIPGGVTYITPEQYQANVAALGKERADAHMLRYNIRIGGQ